ncbi:MAG: MOSC domain-containing protein [Comamonadaceae bacterium]|nr:MOSC domain-containing protein [Comamonadaceae bacterium]
MSTDPVSTPADLRAHIAQLWIHPVKSCAGIAVTEAELTPTGLAWDRAWMVVDSEGEFVTQRELPRMALIQPAFKLGQLVLRAPGMLALHLSLEGAEWPIKVRVWDDVVPAWDMGDVAAQWFSDFLGPDAPAGLKRLRLVRFDPAISRLCSAQWTGGRESVTQFADGFGVLVASTASLDGLNARLATAGQQPVDMRRFRPNIVLGSVEPHDEDRIGAWRIHTPEGVAALENVKPCARCPIPDIDPASAVPAPAVSNALQAYRADPRLNGALSFGMNAIVLAGDGLILRVGQAVTADWRFD